MDSSGHPTSNNTSGFVSRVSASAENSGEQFTDFGGTDLVTFFRETINRNPKDRHFLMKIEKELMDLLEEGSDRIDLRFPSASSYNRMLIHRAAAYFGMDHNVDNETQQCVVVTPTRSSRVPEERFEDMFEQRECYDAARKSILRRDAHSFDDTRQRNYLCPNRGGMLDRRAKSFEERECDYDRARSRVFNRSHYGNEFMEPPHRYRNLEWPNYRSGDGPQLGEPPQRNQRGAQSQRQRHGRGEGSGQQNRNRNDSRMAKMQNSPDRRDKRPSSGTLPKAHSFGGYGGQPSHTGHHPLHRGNSTNSHATTSAALGSPNSGVNMNAVFAQMQPRQQQQQQQRNNNIVRPEGALKTPWRVSPTTDEETPNRIATVYTQAKSTPNKQRPPLKSSASVSEYPSAAAAKRNAFTKHPFRSLGAEQAAAPSDAASKQPPNVLFLAVTHIENVPIGSILINPSTMTPVRNEDG